MKAFKIIESFLICLSLLGLTLLLGVISTYNMGDPISMAVIVAFIIWGFRIRRKLNQENETDVDAFLWMRVIIYTCLIIFPVAETVRQYFDLPDTFKPVLVTTFIAFPFLGASLSMLRLRHNFKN